MDTLTHALSGALAARATARPYCRRGLSLSERTLAGFLAGGFPDLDYALYWFDPLGFLNWHRGPTHSLLLLPLWAGLLAVVLARLMGNRYSWRAFYGVCALGIAAHLLGDIITIYGTKLFSPLSDTPLGLGIVFDVDPYIAVIIAAGFTGALLRRPQRAAKVTLLALLGYLLLQALLQWQAMNLGRAYKERQHLEGGEVYALPQPYSPFMWKVIVAHGERYDIAYLNYLAGKPSVNAEDAWLLWRMIAAYRPLHDLRWKVYYRFGAAGEVESLARRAWRQDRLAAFRQFAVLPALYRVDRDEETCVWFTDLRHVLPALPAFFRYGLCGNGPLGDWRLYRLRYFRVNERQLLK